MTLQEKVDENKLNEFIGKAVTEWGAAMGALLLFVGDRLDLFKAMVDAGYINPEEVARKTNTNPRMIKELLSALAAGGYVVYDTNEATYKLPPEIALALTDDSSPAYIAGGYQILTSLFKDEEKNNPSFQNRQRSWMGRPSLLPF